MGIYTEIEVPNLGLRNQVPKQKSNEIPGNFRQTWASPYMLFLNLFIMFANY